jgi:hypothetical protein
MYRIFLFYSVLTEQFLCLDPKLYCPKYFKFITIWIYDSLKSLIHSPSEDCLD